ncbi:MAG: CHASE3 domain-containing protein [Terriglobia bacterium]
MKSSALKKVSTGLVLALPVLLVLDYLQYQSVQIVSGTHRMLVRSNEALREINTLRWQLAQAEDAVDRYIATGETVALNPFYASGGAVRETLGRLGSLVENVPEQKARIQKLDPLVSKRIELLKQEVALRDQKGLAIEKVRPLESEGHGISDEILSLAGDMEKAEADALKRRSDDARGSVQRATFITPFAAILGIWLVALAALLLFRDATEKKWTGIERRMHTRLVETLPVSIFIVDEHDLIFFTNPAHDALFGYDSGELIGRHASALQSVPRDEADHPFGEISESLSVNGNWAGTLECRKKDGAAFSCFVRARNMDLPGKVYRIFALYELGGKMGG